MLGKITNKDIGWLGIICSLGVILIDIKYMVGFHYLPYISKNLYIREEIKELVSLFPKLEYLRFLFDIIFLILAIFALFLKKTKLLNITMLYGLLLRIILFGVDIYINVFPIFINNSIAATIVKKEWIGYGFFIVLVIVPITILKFRSILENRQN